MPTTDSKKYYYVLLQKHKLIVINKQLPIFWSKAKAQEMQKTYNCDLVRVNGKALEKLLTDSI